MCCIEARRWCEDSNRAPGRPSSPQVSGYSQSCPSVVFVDLHCFAGYVCRLIKMNIDIIGGSVCFLIVFIQNTSTLINCIWIDLQWKNHHAFSTVLCFMSHGLQLRACYADFRQFQSDGFAFLASQNPRLPARDLVALCNTEARFIGFGRLRGGMLTFIA